MLEKQPSQGLKHTSGKHGSGKVSNNGTFRQSKVLHGAAHFVVALLHNDGSKEGDDGVLFMLDNVCKILMAMTTKHDQRVPPPQPHNHAGTADNGQTRVGEELEEDPTQVGYLHQERIEVACLCAQWEGLE